MSSSLVNLQKKLIILLRQTISSGFKKLFKLLLFYNLKLCQVLLSLRETSSPSMLLAYTGNGNQREKRMFKGQDLMDTLISEVWPACWKVKMMGNPSMSTNIHLVKKKLLLMILLSQVEILKQLNSIGVDTSKFGMKLKKDNILLKI